MSDGLQSIYVVDHIAGTYGSATVEARFSDPDVAEQYARECAESHYTTDDPDDLTEMGASGDRIAGFRADHHWTVIERPVYDSISEVDDG